MEIGDEAPDFELPGIHEEEQSDYRLSETTNQGKYVALFFYPFDFSPVCTNELCAIRDAAFFQFMPKVVPWGISGDSTYSHRVFNREYEFNFPLLADSNGSVSDAYHVQYDEWEGHREVPKRAIVLVDPKRRVRYRWTTEDALEAPKLFPFKEALDLIVEEDELEAELSDDELTVDYEDPVIDDD